MRVLRAEGYLMADAQTGQGISAMERVGVFQELVSPLLDLVRVQVEILRQLDQGLLSLDRRRVTVIWTMLQRREAFDPNRKAA